MRNVSDVSATRTVDHYIDGILYRKRTYGYKTKRTFRSDSLSTTKIGGEYITPTPYVATFAFCSPQQGGQVTFKHRSAPGWPWITNTYTQTGCLHDACVGGLLWGCDLNGYAVIPIGVQSRANARALGMLRRGAWDAGQFFAELKETLGFLISPLSSVRSLTEAYSENNQKLINRYRKISGRKPQEEQSLLDGMADLWLSYSYGVKPLLSDIYSILQLVEQGFQTPTAPFSINVEEMDADYGLPGFNDGYFPREVSGTCKRGINLRYNAKIASPTGYQLWRHGLTNPLTWYWDNIRLSFVIDWFLHIRSYLVSLQAPIGVSFFDGYQTVWVKNDYVAKYTLVREGGYSNSLNFTLEKNKQVEARHHLRAMKRSLLYSFPPATTPYVDGGLNLSKVTSLIALILQATR